MASKRSESRPFDILGISEAEENAYRWLLVHPGANVQETARALGLTSNKTQGLLDAIEAKGLVTHSPERPRRYIAAPPDIALKALSLRRQERLRHADAAIRELQEQMANQRQGEQELMVELITSREAERQILAQMDRTAQDEIVALTCPPLVISRVDESAERDRRSQREALTRGVYLRSIVDAELLALPGVIAAIREDIGAGEEVRVIPHLPFKMVLADRRVGLIPLNLQWPDSPSLLVRSSALLDALYALFKILWEQAAPVSFTSAGVVETDDADARLSKLLEDMLSLMAAGLNDKTIASELNISMRTYRRRAGDLMKKLNARTRFQAGWLAARRRQPD